jgi:hypothetical protein
MTVDLRKAIEKKYEGPQTYRNLLKILASSSGDISFWGTRCVSAPGYSGWVHVDDLVKRVDRLILENHEFNQEERAIGKQLAERICALETETEQKLPKKWFWTRFFLSIREFNISNPRCADEYHVHGGYDSYTRLQYIDVFKAEPPVKPFVTADRATFYIHQGWFSTYVINYPSHGRPDRWKAPV